MLLFPVKSGKDDERENQVGQYDHDQTDAITSQRESDTQKVNPIYRIIGCGQAYNNYRRDQ
jgi:hypothetical protein